MNTNPMLQMAQQFGASSITIKIPGAILMCKKGAELRGLNLKVARADAEHWWNTGLAPLRPTPKWWQFWKK